MRIAIALFTLMLLGCGAWWLLQATAGDVVVPVASDAPVSAAAQDAVLAVGDSPVPEATTQREAASPTDQVPAVGSVGQEIVVRTLDAKTRQPLAGVEVLWQTDAFDYSRLTKDDERLLRDDREQFFRQGGSRTSSDAEGRVVLRAQKWLSVMARQDTLFGQGYWHADRPVASEAPYAGEVLVLLEEDRTLKVRAVDSRSRPVSDVQIRLEYDREVPAMGRVVQFLGVANRDGVVLLRHAQTSFHDDVLAAGVRALIAGGEGERTEIDPRNAPTNIVDVLVPAFGSVDVALLGPDGRPWLLPAGNQLMVQVNPQDWEGGPLLDGVNYNKLSIDGRATFRVACGTALAASIGAGWASPVEFGGPQRAGDRVAVELRMAPDARLLAGRLLTSDGKPFAGAVLVRMSGDRGSASSAIDRYPDGRFCFPVPDSLGEKPSLVFSEQVFAERAPLQVDISLRGPLVAGRNELGDVVLAEPPLLVAGQLVFLGEQQASKPSSVWLQVHRRDEPDGPWQQAHDLRVLVDEQQRFKVRAVPKGAAFRLELGGACAPSAPVEFDPGAEGLRIEVQPGSSVAASFLADESSERMSFRLAALEERDEEDFVRRSTQKWREVGHPHRDGDRLRVEWHGLAAGQHRLLVACPGQAPIVDLVVDVPVAGPATDERLQDIDLRGSVRMATVRVTNADGTPFSGKATVALRGAVEQGATWHGQPFDEQTVGGVVFALCRPADLFVTAPGHRGVQKPGVFGDVSVALSPAPNVVLRWPDAPALPTGVRALLRWSIPDWPVRGRGPQLRVVRDGGSRSGGADRALLGPDLPGRLVDGRARAVVESVVPVDLELRLDKQGKRSQLIGPKLRLDPAHLSEGQVIDFAVDPAAVDKALRALSG